MKLRQVIRDFITAFDAGGTGIVVVKLPGRDGAILLDAALDINHSRRSKVRPRELLLAGPDQLHRLARSASETGSFDGAFAGVLAAVPGTGVGNDHAHLVFL